MRKNSVKDLFIATCGKLIGLSVLVVLYCGLYCCLMIRRKSLFLWWDGWKSSFWGLPTICVSELSLVSLFG